MNLQTTWKAGQSSLGAAREAETQLRARFLAALAQLRSITQDCAAATDIPAIRDGLTKFTLHMDDAQHDCGLLHSAWSEEIERLT